MNSKWCPLVVRHGSAVTFIRRITVSVIKKKDHFWYIKQFATRFRAFECGYCSGEVKFAKSPETSLYVSRYFLKMISGDLSDRGCVSSRVLVYIHFSKRHVFTRTFTCDSHKCTHFSFFSLTHDALF